MAKDWVTEEEIMNAREVDLLSYLEAKGEKFKKEGYYYRHLTHDSLVIRNNMYAWNSRGEKGYGAVKFAQLYYNMSFQEAIRDINSENYEKIEKTQAQIKESKEPFRYPKEDEVSTNSAIKNYLTNERKIDPRLVNWLIKKDLIAQDQKNNVVFKWRDQGGKGEIVGAERQGTIKTDNKRGSFKQILANGKEHSGFTVDVGKPESIYFFESPIDALSYWSIKQEELQNARLVSMNGLKMKTVFESCLDMHKEGLEIKNVVIAVDNDQAGKEFIKKMDSMYNWDKFKVDIPVKEKDWNDMLRKMAGNKQEISQHKEPIALAKWAKQGAVLER
ncbi:toprim domain-containing protein [Metabacillus fastidiosus]|uniref:toprim domain-containing protein n=1 Tax=Metabacillus fastidiosus TaxID=1458 RepID=UPI003D29A705